MSDHRPTDPAKVERQKRLEAQLRANLKRRKAGARASTEAPKADRSSEAAPDENDEA